MNTSISITLSAEELSGIVKAAVQEALYTHHTQFQTHTAEKYLTRLEVAKLYRISLPTVTSYTERGIIIGEKVGARWRYKSSDIEAGHKIFKKYVC